MPRALEAISTIRPGQYKKAYVLYGNRATISVVLKNCFPARRTAQDASHVATSEPGVVIVPLSMASEAVGYISQGASDVTYVVVGEEDKPSLGKVSGLVFIDCTDPATPSTKKATIEFITAHTGLAESQAILVGRRARWHLPDILHFTYVWRCLVSTTVSSSQANHIIDTVLPQDEVTQFVEDLITKKFHRVSAPKRKPRELIAAVANGLHTVKVVKEAQQENSNASRGTLEQKTGLKGAEFDYYVKLSSTISNQDLNKWGEAIVWCYNRQDNPGIVKSLITQMAG